MPDVGHSDEGTFSAEKIIALKPDVLFIAEMDLQRAEERAGPDRGAGIPIVVIDYNAQITGAPPGLDPRHRQGHGHRSHAPRNWPPCTSANTATSCARIAKAGGGPKKKVYVELGQAGPDTVGNSYSGTMWGKIVTVLGAENLADGKLPGPWGPLNAEGRHRRRPRPDLHRRLVLGQPPARRQDRVRGDPRHHPQASLEPYARAPAGPA
jgi:iron complex transport system substrate-binding protein